jgi:hypothetical protein
MRDVQLWVRSGFASPSRSVIGRMWVTQLNLGKIAPYTAVHEDGKDAYCPGG